MSSHREAPAISKDPVADSTDTYVFVTPGKPDTLTIISNYIPGEAPAGGPNFYEFGDDVLYEINIDNDGDIDKDVSFKFRFQTEVRNPDTFLYNTGPITSLDSANWNRRQFYSVSVQREGDSAPTVLGSHLSSPPCNIGPRSTPDYPDLANAANHTISGGIRVFAGQRADPFFVDLGSIFDLGALRPIQSHHLIPLPNAPGVNTLRDANVHTIAIQVPISMVTRNRNVPTNAADPASVIGVWAAAYRRRITTHEDDGDTVGAGAWVQVSRLANPLFNEVIVPMGDKDRWNALDPDDDNLFLKYVQHPELAKLLPILYPGAFPNLAGLTAERADLVAVLLTGIPSGIVPGFQNFTGPKPADLLRLNVAIAPSSSPNPLGLVGGDAAGFPNGRRLQDDVTTIELRAVAGLTYPLVNPSYTPDAVVPAITDGLTIANSGVHYLSHFPYVGLPHDGFHTPAH